MAPTDQHRREVVQDVVKNPLNEPNAIAPYSKRPCEFVDDTSLLIVVQPMTSHEGD